MAVRVSGGLFLPPPPHAFYLTFDNKEVGRLQAREVFKVAPEGNYVFIKGSPTDPKADFLHAGQLAVLKEAMDAGKIKIVGEQYTDFSCGRLRSSLWLSVQLNF